MQNKAMVRNNEGFELSTLDEMTVFCEHAFRSKMFSDVRDVSQAVMKVSLGQELGLKPMSSLRSIYFYNGALSMSAHLMNALCKKAGYMIAIPEHTDKVCVVEVHKDKQKIGSVRYTIENAKKANLLNKKNWRDGPEDMLYARAMSRAANRFCAEVFLGGVYTPEEMQDALGMSRDAEDSTPFDDGDTQTILEQAEIEAEILDSHLVEENEEQEQKETTKKQKTRNNKTERKQELSDGEIKKLRTFARAVNMCEDDIDLDQAMDEFQNMLEDIPSMSKMAKSFWTVRLNTLEGTESQPRHKKLADEFIQLVGEKN